MADKKFELEDIQQHLKDNRIIDFDYYLFFHFRKYELDDGVIYELHEIWLENLDTKHSIYTTNPIFKQFHIKNDSTWGKFYKIMFTEVLSTDSYSGISPGIHNYIFKLLTTPTNISYHIWNFFKLLRQISADENMVIQNIEDLNLV